MDRVCGTPCGGVELRVTLDVSAVPAQPAGAGRYVIEIARRLPSAVDTTLVTQRGDRTRWTNWSPRAEVVDSVPTNRVTRLGFEAWWLSRRGEARRTDIWHGPHYTMPHHLSHPAVVTIHDMTFFSHPQWHESTKAVFFRQAIRYASHHAAALICVSETTARDLREKFNPTMPVVVAPHGVDHERFRPRLDDEWPGELPTHRPYILFVGTVEPRKGLDVLLDAFRDIAIADSEVELWIAGQAGWKTSKWESQLASHPAASRIRRLGFVSDAALPIAMSRASCVVYPSRGEGFGLPVLEALACGAPVVTSAGTVMEEVAGGTARLAPVGDADALAHQIELALAESSGVRRDRQEAGIARAREFTWERSLALHLEAYRLAL